MNRVFAFILLVSLILGSCTQRMICPAYQSAFIYDKDELRKKFSYFLGDSTPKVYSASKNKYLVAEPTTYKSKIRSMQTVAMKPVNVVVPDSLTGEGKDSVSMADFDRAARSIRDSIVIADVPRDTVPEELDSIYVISKDKELRLLKYNMPDTVEYDSVAGKYVIQKPSYYVAEVRYQMEQDNYMWYLRDAIVLPDVRLAKLGQMERGKESSEKKEKQGLKGFFKNLFKKKPKEEVDSASLQAPAKDEFDYIDEPDTTLQAEIPQPGQENEKPKKKAKVKKKKERRVKVSPKKDNKPDATAPETEPAEKKEDEDDGF